MFKSIFLSRPTKDKMVVYKITRVEKVEKAFCAMFEHYKKGREKLHTVLLGNVIPPEAWSRFVTNVHNVNLHYIDQGERRRSRCLSVISSSSIGVI